MGKSKCATKTPLAILATIMLVACVSAQGVEDARMNPSVRKQVNLSDMKLSFETPSSKLRPSKDFPPPRLASNVDLSQVKEPKILFHGYWDGPNYQWHKTMGTLRIWLEVRPWPHELSALHGCDAKAMAYIESRFARSLRNFDKGHYKVKPKLEVNKVRIAGTEAHSFSIDLDVPPETTYVIPLDDKFFLRLMLVSIRNSDPSAGWDELSWREQEKFLSSLQLTGDKLGCSR